jgi:hypothetical protein
MLLQPFSQFFARTSRTYILQKSSIQENTLPRAGVGGGYQPMSLGLENIKRGWEKGEIEGKWGKKGLCMKLESKRIK